MFAPDGEDEGEAAVPVWPAFGDMMACLFGMFALFFTWSVVLEAGTAEELRAEGLAVLSDVAAPLGVYHAAHDAMIMVRGFTDDRPRRGDADHDNWDLSAERAMTVVRALIAAGLPGDRVFGAGFGEAHPVAPNDTDEGRARNRRVEIAPVPRMVGASR